MVLPFSVGLSRMNVQLTTFDNTMKGIYSTPLLFDLSNAAYLLSLILNPINKNRVIYFFNYDRFIFSFVRSGVEAKRGCRDPPLNTHAEFDGKWVTECL